MTEKKIKYSTNPLRRSQPWNEDEVVGLLASIEDIAKDHECTENGKLSYIKKMAVDFHLNDKRSMEDIQRLTGLTKEQIEHAIKEQEATTKKIPSLSEIISSMDASLERLKQLLKNTAK